MKLITVTMVRIYITEVSGLLTPILKYLQQEAKIRGVTVFRAISGYGEQKQLHSALLVDLSVDLPLVIEFFDEPQKITAALDHLKVKIKPEHIVCWSAQANDQNGG